MNRRGGTAATNRRQLCLGRPMIPIMDLLNDTDNSITALTTDLPPAVMMPARMETMTGGCFNWAASLGECLTSGCVESILTAIHSHNKSGLSQPASLHRSLQRLWTGGTYAKGLP